MLAGKYLFSLVYAQQTILFKNVRHNLLMKQNILPSHSVNKIKKMMQFNT
jgi:hypothetical protein